MYSARRVLLSIVVASLIGKSASANPDDKVVEMMRSQVYLLSIMSGLDTLAMQTYVKFYELAIYDRVIAQVIKKARGQQSLSDFARAIGLSQDQLTVSEQTGKGLTGEVLEKIWQTGTPLTAEEIQTIQNRETLATVSNSEVIVFQATAQYVRGAIISLIYLQTAGTTEDGAKPTVEELLAGIKENYGRLLVFAKDNMPQVSLDNLIAREDIDAKLTAELTEAFDNQVALSQHVGRRFLQSKIEEAGPASGEKS